ncbi:transporter [Amycolatopsis cynarae]|uniref:Transporter n=1 Tax=Amycolatopsis cynarae TaxID=2995223 RepID=A0ABY7AY52_9PSEU|nr:transporter [Amycolatopsis sp. HUAS 11-8]WAL64640.1 transporter [Amycolatopsis sp. HUAS 11-8]
MIWLTWRQHRRQALAALITFAALAAFLVPTGLAMRHTFATLGLPDCLRQLGSGGGEFVPAGTSDTCGTALKQFKNEYGTLSAATILLVVLPLLAGLFWGAPLVAREVEQGTHRMIWTQGVSRRHWALVKFGLVGGAALLASILYGLAVSWWYTPLAQSGNGRFDTFAFDIQGVAPVGYTAFAVLLGVYAGTVWRKVLPAMAATLTGFVAIRILLTALARPNYLPARTLTFPVRGVSPAMDPALGNWVVSQDVRDATGKVVMANAQVGCPPQDATCGGLGEGTYNLVRYQPGDRFWLFQGIETGIFVVLAAVLLYLALRRLRHIA